MEKWTDIDSIIGAHGVFNHPPGQRFLNFLDQAQKITFSGVFRMKYWCSIFQIKKNMNKQKFKITKKIEFLLVMSFLVNSGHFR